ncbi:MAG: hypothetical protein GX125_02080 [Bacteroidales bacterium]|jgi:hypothetical protein|nr:hypothetical protein [Bacteroidota bacterium]NLN99047.1 hypothetical protein [Bacteroidales bacterium]
MTIQEDLNSFGIADIKGFDDHEVIAALPSVDAEEKEKSAFTFLYISF